ncbi:MAG TPA: class I SAM-dependent methyltransferase [Gammaproteobacteria bacterium]
MAAADVRLKLYETLWAPPVKRVLERIRFVRRIYNGWERRHPFDVAHGLDTSGYLPAAQCAPGDAAMASEITCYGGSQPSIVRAVLARLPVREQYAFVDLGCGKGRPLAVASEFPFRRIVGIEIAPELAAVARSNAAILASRHPDRRPIEIEIGDATTPTPPGEHVVYFMYHAFGEAFTTKLVESIEIQLRQGLQHAFFVYYNPVHASVIDRSPCFERWSADVLPYASDEVGYGPDLRDTVVVWQSRPSRYAALPGATKHVNVAPAGVRAHLS